MSETPVAAVPGPLRSASGPGAVTGPVTGAEQTVAGRFPPQLLFAAATLYYQEDATQAEVAARLGTSRATVSRLLAEARRSGIVRIEVVRPDDVQADPGHLAADTAAALDLRTILVAPPLPHATTGASLAPALSSLLADVGLTSGDVLLVSSGRTVYEAAQADLPHLPGLLVAPTVGGQDEPEPWYQTNEITRLVAAKVGGTPAFLYAPALPGPHLHERLLEDPPTRRVLSLWEQARCALIGIGAPPLLRRSLPRFVPTDPTSLREAVGDVCTRFYDSAGALVPFPGSERVMATSLEVLRRIPVSIALAVGLEKVPSIIAAARAGYFTHLVTDAPTMTALAAAVLRPAVGPVPDVPELVAAPTAD